MSSSSHVSRLLVSEMPFSKSWLYSVAGHEKEKKRKEKEKERKRKESHLGSDSGPVDCGCGGACACGDNVCGSGACSKRCAALNCDTHPSKAKVES